MTEATEQTSTASAAQAAPTAAAPATPASNNISFHPILQDAHAGKEGKTSALSHAGLNFDLSSASAFYPTWRSLGYSFAAAYSPIVRSLKDTHSAANTKQLDGDLTFSERMCNYLFGDKPVVSGNETLHYKNFLNKVEAVIFCTMGALHSWDAAQQVKEQFKLAVAAEMGKDEEDVTFSDLRHSNNPLVVSAVDKLMWQAGMRTGSGLAFLHSVGAGIFATTAGVVTAERTIFYRPLASDILAKAVNDVQVNSLGDEAKNDLTDNLIRVVQAQRIDHRLEPLSPEKVAGLRPVLDAIADDVIDKKFGITGMNYIMGGGGDYP